MCSPKRGAWPMHATSVETQMSPDKPSRGELLSAENTGRLTPPEDTACRELGYCKCTEQSQHQDPAVASDRALALSKPPPDSFLIGNSSTTV